MSSPGQALVKFLKGTITAVQYVGDRIFRDHLPEKTSWPAIVVQVDDDFLFKLKASTKMTKLTATIHCMGDRGPDVEILAREIRDRLVGSGFTDDDVQLYQAHRLVRRFGGWTLEDRLYNVTLECDMWAKVPA